MYIKAYFIWKILYAWIFIVICSFLLVSGAFAIFEKKYTKGIIAIVIGIVIFVVQVGALDYWLHEWNNPYYLKTI